MSIIILYLVICAAGVLIALPLRHMKGRMGWLDGAQTLAVFCLVFTMGARIGANDEVVRSLPVYGVYAVVITLAILAASVAAVSVLRRVMGINRYGKMAGAAKSSSRENEVSGFRFRVSGEEKGNMKPETRNPKPPTKVIPTSDTAAAPPPSPSYRMTVYILCFVALGILAGRFLIPRLFSDFNTFDSLASTAITVELSTLLFLVGMALGLKEGLAAQIRAVGFRVLAIPLAALAGTLLAAALLGLVLPIGVKNTLAVAAGLGWYSLAPGMLMDAGNMTAGAISFLHNVMRELFSIVLIPLVAQKVGYVETVGMPGAAAMDSSLPIVVKATSPGMAVYSFLSGLILTLIVPMLVPVFF